MNFIFSGRRMDIGEALTNHSKEACKGLSQKYSVDFIDIHIIMEKTGHLYQTEISMKSVNGFLFSANVEKDTPYGSLDLAIDKIEAQIQKKKNMAQNQYRIKPQHLRQNENMIEANDSEHIDAPLIIAEMMDDLPEISVSQAADMLNNNIVVVFKNKLTGMVNVVYKRSDGNVGWVDYRE